MQPRSSAAPTQRLPGSFDLRKGDVKRGEQTRLPPTRGTPNELRRPDLVRRTRIACLCGALLASVGVQRALAQSNAAGEYQVKAAFLFHFAQFVEWPEGMFRSANEPLTYCVLGEDPFRGALEASVSGKSVGTHPVQVQHFKQAVEARSCQVVFIGATGKKTVMEALANLKGPPVLTVGDSEHFAEEGGMIGFCLEDNKVRFEINAGAAEQAQLKISARLLALASKVIGGPKGS